MEILLLRHGKTQGNLERRYVGSTDEPILDAWRTALSRGQAEDFSPERIFLSPMRRCRETAEAVFGKRLVEEKGRTVRDLRETEFGEFEYKNYEELKDHPAYQAWIDSGGRLAFPGGESGTEFRRRAVRAFQSCLQQAEQAGWDRIAMVTHGGVIMAVMEACVGAPGSFYDWQVENGGGFLLEDNGGRLQLKKRIKAGKGTEV